MTLLLSFYYADEEDVKVSYYGPKLQSTMWWESTDLTRVLGNIYYFPCYGSRDTTIYGKRSLPEEAD